jgi:hypothetical protein
MKKAAEKGRNTDKNPLKLIKTYKKLIKTYKKLIKTYKN